MAIEITVPRLGWSMDEGIFGEWLKKDGEFVAAGQPVFLLESEKALQEVETVDSGILSIVENGPTTGNTVRVGTVIAWLLEEGEAPPTQGNTESAAGISGTTFGNSSSAAGYAQSVTIPGSPLPNSDSFSRLGSQLCGPDFRPFASPSVRRLARELGVDLASLNADGTVSEYDVRRAAAAVHEVQIAPNDSPVKTRSLLPGSDSPPRRNADPSLLKISPRAARTAKRLNVDWTTLKGSGRNGRIREQDILAVSEGNRLPTGTIRQASPVRSLIAERVAWSSRSTVPVTLTTTVQIDGLFYDRARRKRNLAVEAVVPALHDYLIVAVAQTLVEHPALNSRWLNGEILQPDGIHIGIAVDTKNGLIVPVVRDVGHKSLEDIAAASASLIARAREGKLTTAECADGTFTISNLGSFGIDAFTPIINGGQCAILGAGATRKTPMPSDDCSLTWSQQMTLNLTFDHQVTDGAPAARFLQQLCSTIQNSGNGP